MENKKHYVDGVDVSECNFYQIEANELYPKAQYCGSMRNTFCENEPNCYYKQLKRLQHYQAEFEHELMNDYTYDGYISPNGFTPIDVIKHIKSELQRLEQEIFELKESLKCFQTPEAIKALTFYKTGEFELQEKKCIKLEQECERLKKENERLKKENERLKEEKKQLLKDCNSCNFHKYSQCLKEIKEIAEKQIYTDDFIRLVLAKINEVIGVN